MSFHTRLNSANAAATLIKLAGKAGFDADKIAGAELAIWVGPDGNVHCSEGSKHREKDRCRAGSAPVTMTVSELAVKTAGGQTCTCTRDHDGKLYVYCIDEFRELARNYGAALEIALCTQALEAALAGKPASTWAAAERKLDKALEWFTLYADRPQVDAIAGASVVEDVLHRAETAKRTLRSKLAAGADLTEIAKTGFRKAGIKWRTNDIEVIVRLPNVHIAEANKATLAAFALTDAPGLYAGPAELAVLAFRHAIGNDKSLKVELAVVDIGLPASERAALARMVAMLDNRGTPLAELVANARAVIEAT